MRDPKRIKLILKYLEKYWEKYPDLRLGQIISNLTPENHRRKDQDGFTVPDPYHVEDVEWLAIFLSELDKIREDDT